jgi:hypothetical protein
MPAPKKPEPTNQLWLLQNSLRYAVQNIGLTIRIQQINRVFFLGRRTAELEPEPFSNPKAGREQGNMIMKLEVQD